MACGLALGVSVIRGHTSPELQLLAGGLRHSSLLPLTLSETIPAVSRRRSSPGGWLPFVVYALGI